MMNTSKPTWILFDVGGVLYHFEKAIDETEKYLGISKGSFLSVFNENLEEIEISKIHYKEIIIEKLSLLKLDAKLEKIIPILFDVDKFLTDTLLLAKQLQEGHYSLALMTNTWHGITDEVTAKLEEFALFTHVFDSTKLRLRKPEDAIFSHVEKTLLATKGEIFFIDDSIKNIAVAKLHHWQTFHYSLKVDEGKSSNDELRKQLLS